MLINSKKGNINSLDTTGKELDWLPLEWYETNKRMLRKTTLKGRELILKFLNESPEFTQGDILSEEANHLVVVEVLACDSLVIKPATMFEMASVCYEIGNKHLPLFYDKGELLVPFDLPLSRLLVAQGYTPLRENRKLLTPLKTTVSPHGSNDTTSLFSRIMKLTNAEK